SLGLGGQQPWAVRDHARRLAQTPSGDGLHRRRAMEIGGRTGKHRVGRHLTSRLRGGSTQKLATRFCTFVPRTYYAAEVPALCSRLSRGFSSRRATNSSSLSSHTF